MMTLDYALIHVSLWLSHLANLCWCEEVQIVDHITSPFNTVGDALNQLLEVPGIGGFVLAIVVIPVGFLVSLVGVIVTALAYLGINIASDAAYAAGPVLAHAMAIGWTIVHALGGA